MFKNFVDVLKSRNATLMLLASLTSTFGDWAYFIAISVHLVNHAGTALLAAIATVRFGCVFALGPLGGAIVDRLPKKTVMIITDIIRFSLMLALGATMRFAPNAPITVAALSILSSIVGLLFSPARRALLPQTVDESQRLALNAIDGSIGTVTLTLAPALAGIFLMWMTPSDVVALNGGSFLCSAFFLLALSPFPPKLAETPSTSTRYSILNDMKSGVLHIVHDRDVSAITLLAFINHVAVGATWIFVPLMSLKLDLPASGTGYLSSAIGAGSVVGMLMGGSIRGMSELRMAFIAVLSFTFSVAAWSFLSVSVIGAFLGAAAMGLTANLFEAPCWSSFIARKNIN